MNERNLLRLLAGLILLVAMLVAPPAIAIKSTFDGNLDGWVSNNGDVVWNSSGGSPGGFAHFEDQTEGIEAIEAPSKFLGNWSDLDETGELLYDHKIITVGDLGTVNPYFVQISGPGGTAEWTGATPPASTTDWTVITVPISQSSWSVQSGSWVPILSDVTSLSIRIEQMANVGEPQDVAGIDNVELRGQLSSTSCTDYICNFHSDTQAWTSNFQTNISWSATGGNPDGYLRFDDLVPGNARILAPPEMLVTGDLSLGEKLLTTIVR